MNREQMNYGARDEDNCIITICMNNDWGGVAPATIPSLLLANLVRTADLRGKENAAAPSEIELSDAQGMPHSENVCKESIDEDQYFQDGERKIDYILVYKVKDMEKTNYIENLEEAGLETEKDKENDTIFVKLHAPWEVLARYAEEMKIKMPIKLNKNKVRKPTSSRIFPGKPRSKDYVKSAPNFSDIAFFREKEGKFNIKDKKAFFSNATRSRILNENKIGKPPNSRTCPGKPRSKDYVKPEPNCWKIAFVQDREEKFNIKDKETFFSNATRSRIVHEILEKCTYDNGNKCGYGHMIADGSLVAAYPLHDGDWKSGQSDRQLLYQMWAKPKNFYKQQPLDLVRRYFGEKIGIYFSWLGYYTVMLAYAAIFGVAAFLWGCITLGSNVKVAEICDTEGVGSIIMCPLCDERCDYFHLSSSCYYSKLTYLFDNGATVFFACFMSLWGTMFCEFWKRRENAIAQEWDLFGFEENEEKVRPEYERNAPQRRRSPITHEMGDPYASFWYRFPRLSFSIITTVFMVLLSVAAVIAVIVYRISVKSLTSSKFGSSTSSIVTSVTATVISTIIIMTLQNVYEKIAVWLTNLELHRTETEFEDSLISKSYFLAFFNYYSTSFYIAFVKGKLPGNPSEYGKIFGLRQEECDASGCMQELFINIAITMCVKQFVGNFKELGTPVIFNFIRKHWGRHRAKKGDGKYERWQQDFYLAELGPRGLFNEYLEMVIQFGFTTIFVAAFPLAPFFALLNNLIEIRLDAFKFISQFRRPYPARAQDIGAWYAILLGIGNLAVLTNALVLAFTSEFIPQSVYEYQYGGGLAGYMEFSLSVFNVEHFEDGSAPVDSAPEFENVTECRYRGYYTGPNPPYNLTTDNWMIMAMKLGFVLLYEHVIYLIKMALAYIIPDVPEYVRNQIRRENYLEYKALQEVILSRKHILV